MVTHNYLLLLTTTKSIYASSVIHWTCRVYFTLLGVNSSGVSALGHKPCSVNLALYCYYYYYYYHYHYHYHYQYYYYWTSDSLKPTLNRRSNKSPEFGPDQCCHHRSPKTGYGVEMMSSLDSQGEGKKLLRLHARTLTYTLTCSSWPKLPSSVSQ